MTNDLNILNQDDTSYLPTEFEFRIVRGDQLGDDTDPASFLNQIRDIRRQQSQLDGEEEYVSPDRPYPNIEKTDLNPGTYHVIAYDDQGNLAACTGFTVFFNQSDLTSEKYGALQGEMNYPDAEIHARCAFPSAHETMRRSFVSKEYENNEALSYGLMITVMGGAEKLGCKSWLHRFAVRKTDDGQIKENLEATKIGYEATDYIPHRRLHELDQHFGGAEKNPVHLVVAHYRLGTKGLPLHLIPDHPRVQNRPQGSEPGPRP